ncbi:L,D-transpeptidase [Actinoplanes sp. NPDC051859]|uniref:L,D-transpeptidase n=1 Tax=Actinoplanes sp. NPDC051859 TaxID=3363909 RepID=UPI003788FEB9
MRLVGSSRAMRVLCVAGVAMVLTAVTLTVVSTRHHPPAPANVGTHPITIAPAPIAVPHVPAEVLRRLPVVDTEATLTRAPHQPTLTTAGTSSVVHNPAAVPVFTAPGGRAFARLPKTQLGNDTWLPVVAEQPGWVQVLLPSRPNGSAGWLAAAGLRRAITRHELRVDLAAARLDLLRDGEITKSWTVTVGTSDTPTPTGDTFLLASIRDPQQPWTPLILALGTHSTVFDRYAGGPGTVAIHAWTSAPTGQPGSHGCIRVPTSALRTLAQVPLGTLVRVASRKKGRDGRA